MQFLKNHYEKIILSLVLLGLVGAVSVLFIRVSSVKNNLKKIEENLGNIPHKPIEVRTHDEYEQALTKGTNPPPINLVSGHRLVNPYRWVKNPNGDIIKVMTGEEIGAGAIQVVRVSNLNFVVTFERVSGAGANPSYVISTYRMKLDRGKKNHFLRAEETTKPFTYGGPDNPMEAKLKLKSVKGDAATPEELVFDLERPDEQGGVIEVVVKPGAPYQELAYREADLSYPPENRTFTGVKVGDTLTLGGETYKVIAITDKQVIFEAANNKRTIINYTPIVP